MSEVSSYFRILDLEQRRVTFRAPVPESVWRAQDPNPRGGQRGARGVSVHGDRLVIANAERLFVFDRSWRLLAQLTHPMFADIHDVLAQERGIWVTSAGCDALLLVSWEGELEDWWSFRSDPTLYRRLGYRRSNLPPVRPELDYRDPRVRAESADSVHLNGVVPSGDELLLSFGRVINTGDGTAASALVRLPMRKRLGRRRGTLVHRRRGIEVPDHNIGEEDGLLLYNDSNLSRLVAIDAASAEERTSVEVPGEPPFVRGLTRLAPGRWLVGSQAPLAVYAIDLGRGVIVEAYELGGVENETVFGICPLPDVFGDPPPMPAGDDDPYTFWRQASSGTGVTRIPA